MTKKTEKQHLMIKKYILLSICVFTFINCGFKRIQKDEFGEPNLNGSVKYNFTEIPNDENLKKIDTSAYYVQIFEGRYYNESEKENPQVLIFHNDGYFKKESILYFGKNDTHRTKKSIYYGGKYKIKDNIIELEEFLPSTGGGTNYYVRKISKGKIEGNKIIFDSKNNLINVFEKKQKLN